MIALSKFRGYDRPVRELYNQIGQLGWSVVSVDFNKDKYECKIKSPNGKTVVRNGPDPVTAVGNAFLYATRAQYGITAAQVRLGMWDHGRWVNQLEPIARAYAEAPVYDPKAAGAWMELAHDSDYRAQVLRNQLKIEVVDSPEPYASAKEMCDDVHKNRHFLVSRANSDHPLWTEEQNINFRIVHDILGHCVSGGDFGWEGENKACAAHFPLLSPNAQHALFTECFAPETLIRTSKGYRAISDIDTGEFVLSGDGKYHEVYDTFSKDFTGDLYELETKTTLGPIRVTGNHPVLALVSQHKKTRSDAIYPQRCNPGKCNGPNVEKRHSLEWIGVERLQEGDYIVINVPEEKMNPTTVTIPIHCRSQRPRSWEKFEYVVSDEFLWIVGIYLAEGSSYNGRVSFGLHRKEIEYANRIISFFSEQGYKCELRTFEGNGIEVNVHSTTFARWFAEWLGKGCANKSIPSVLLNLDDERLQHVIDGIMDGDGYIEGNFLGQTSPLLALQVAELSLRRNGKPSISCWTRENKKDIYGVEEASIAHKLPRRRGRRGYWNICGKTLVRIENLAKNSYSGKVYDLSVREDPTFTVQNILVHNCIGQTGYGAHYRNFGPQKVALMPQFVNPAQEAENSPAHTGIHPSQSLAPTSMPEVQSSPSVGLPQGTPAPHQTGEYGVWSKVAQGLTQDINQGWSSTAQPIPYEQGGNAFEHGGDPLHAFRPGGMMDTASKIDTGWSQSANEDGSPNLDTMKQAIVNAFRVVLLSPRKDLHWNAVHYQDISQVPANAQDPKIYWDALEAKRRAWNVARGHPEDSHMIWYKPLERFRQIVRTKHPNLPIEQVNELADDTFWEWRQEEEHRIAAEDNHKPEDKRRGADEIERRANEALAKRLVIYNADNDPKNDQVSLFSAVPEQESLLNVPQTEAPDVSKYGAFMGTHLKSIAQISQHVDDILQAALQDVAQGGTGHIFRAHVLGLNISGVGPKVCSFAWLLLQPLTSQLATIDVHMMRALGHDYDKEMNPRDYFKFERELAARRDASGYGAIPLGAFQWGTWDAQRSGMGSHQDHSAMRVLDPVPHDQVDWAAHGAHTQGSILQDEPWWQATQPAADKVAHEWDTTVAPNFPQNQIPMIPGDQVSKTAASAFTGSIPWFTHPQTNEQIVGQPGQGLMHHIRTTLNLSTPEVWKVISDGSAGKENLSNVQ